MRGSADKGTAGGNSSRVDFDSDRHTPPAKALSAIASDISERVDDNVDRIEIGFEANGDVTYRFRVVGSVDYDFALLSLGDA